MNYISVKELIWKEENYEEYDDYYDEEEGGLDLVILSSC